MDQTDQKSDRTVNTEIVIVGGGMGGLVLAMALAQQGRSVVIVERQASLRPIARGELLQPNGLKIFDRLGLSASLRDLPSHRAHQFHFHRIGGKRLCTVDYRSLPPPWNHAIITQPHHLLKLLLEKINQSGRVRLLTGVDFKELILEDNRPAGIRAEKDGRLMEIRSSMVVGSDGARSQVREAAGIPFRLHTYREGYLTMVVPRPSGYDDDARYYVGRGEILGCFPVSEQELYLFYMIPADRLEATRRQAVGTITAAISRIDPALIKPLQTVTAWSQVGFMPCLRVRAGRWTADGIALIGDAAHAMNPHVAQGRNQAMEDAMTLAEVIQDCFASGDFRHSRLNSYEMKRRPTVERLQKMGDELTWLWNTALPPLAWFRDRIFEGMERHPPVREQVLKTISGLEVRPMGVVNRLRVFLP